MTAQEATPEAETGLTVEVLGAGPSAEAPGQALILLRVTFPAGFSEPRRHVHPFDYVLAIESGAFAFTIETGTLQLTRAALVTPAAGTPTAAAPEVVPLGVEMTIGPGDSIAGNREVVWASERAVGDEPVVGVVAHLGAPDAPNPQYLDATPTP